ncbi:hypothetical protein BOTBODRAFT_103986 [Botryobasidium botryosum FD-172 SS1]|uniref:Coiled-coil domain-containing protein n=1 Tax=Botryobasidium botryosum (strain FD-172 SS1) TaxID=930990 RepID=A0A067MVE9_BOTB1|nr:hypothetical protein BOTBODRAFT_103986 [Botryobasidium botryosum FD-172 SS1]
MAAGGLATGASGTSTPKSPPKSEFEVIPPESFSATGIDDALELLSIVGAKTDKASVGQAAAGIEQHPERRYKAAFEAYQERELPKLKVEHPGLRLNQYKELLHKKFLKSPDNPFNQTTVSYDASKQEKVAALKQKHALVEERLRDQ